MYQDNLFRELIIDNFAGGGGASTGIELALGQPVDIAINHDGDAIAMHKVNHPYTKHYQEDVFAIEPEQVTGGRPVGVAWFSPDCKHFSRAKGGKPVEKKIRGLSWVILKWALSKVAPRVIFMENVPEIQTWCPLIEQNGKLYPDMSRKGETFNGFISMLTNGINEEHPALQEACEFLNIEIKSKEYYKLVHGLGYSVKFKELKACDYGAPTIRKRFYLIARNDGLPIVFPKPTHGAAKGLMPYRSAAECIDFTIPCKSIFCRNKDLSENTLRRIARGLDKFVIKNPKPFIMQMNYENTPQDIDTPLSTITAINKHYVVNPTIVPIGYGERKGQAPRVNDISTPLSTVVSTCKQNLIVPQIEPYIMTNNTNNAPHSTSEPLPTITTGNRNFLCAPSLIQYHSEQRKCEVRGQKIDKPIMTIDSSPRYALNACYISKYFSGEKQAGSDIKKPLSTITGIDHNSLVTVNLSCRYGNGKDGRGKPIDSPLPTVTSTDHNELIATNLLHYYGGADHSSNANNPLATVTTLPRHYLIASNLCVLRKNTEAKSFKEPLSTITTKQHFIKVDTYLVKYDNKQDLKNWGFIRKLLNDYAGYTIAQDEILIIEINGLQYYLADIGMRMLKAKELMLAQGFPPDYILDIESHIGKKYSEAKQIARMGHAVCPPVATALVQANCVDIAIKKAITTMSQLEKVLNKSLKRSKYEN